MTWTPPWSSRALGYFTSPKTIEYRFTRRELAALFGREENTVPGGFCTDIGSMVQHLIAQRGAPAVDQAAGWGEIEADPATRPMTPEERARAQKEVAEDLLRKIDKDRQRWLNNGGTVESFNKLKMCGHLDDPLVSRSIRVDTRAHERLHSKVQERVENADLKLLRFLETLFERNGENRFLPLTMRNISMQKRWSYARDNHVEEVLARVEGYAAAERDILRKKQNPAGLRIIHQEYGGSDFEAFRQALARTGYTPARVLREALR